jgi:hypothetical protein
MTEHTTTMEAGPSRSVSVDIRGPLTVEVSTDIESITLVGDESVTMTRSGGYVLFRIRQNEGDSPVTVRVPHGFDVDVDRAASIDDQTGGAATVYDMR